MDGLSVLTNNPVHLELPWPPSINHYWRHAKGRHYISLEGSVYRETVFWSTTKHRSQFKPEDRLSVHIEAYPPDKRKRDLDNILKSLLDALQHAGIYKDDSQIDRLSIARKMPLKGIIKIVVEPID